MDTQRNLSKFEHIPNVTYSFAWNRAPASGYINDVLCYDCV